MWKAHFAVVVLSVLAMTAAAESGPARSVHLKLNEGSGTTAFDSGGGKHANIAGDPVWVNGQFGVALQLDGDADYLKMDEIYGLTSEQTKMLWVNMKHFSEDGVYLIDQGADGNNNWIELFDANGDGYPQVRTGFDSFNYIDSIAELRPGYWYHVAVVSRSTGDVAIYINGVLDKSASQLCPDNMPKGLVIGTDWGTRTACFTGLIDEIVICDRPLSAGEIKHIYQSAVGRYRHAMDNTRFAIESIRQAIAAKEDVLAGLDIALKKTWLAYESLVRFGSADYDPVSNRGVKMITARQKLKADMLYIERSREDMKISIEQLEGVLVLLGQKPNSHQSDADKTLADGPPETPRLPHQTPVEE